MTILRLSLANMKKKKSLTATLLLLSFLTALFLNIALTVLTQMDQAFWERTAELNSPDFFVISENTNYRTEFETFLLEDDRVSYVEKEEVIYMENCENSVNPLKTGAVFFNLDTERTIEPLHLLEQDDSVPQEKAIYLPVTLKNTGAALGGDYTIRFKNIDYSFQVAGFFETTYFGTSSSAFFKYYIPDETFRKLYVTAGSGTVLSAKLKDRASLQDMAASLQDDFLDHYHTKLGGLLVISNCFTIVGIQEITTMLISLPMTIIIGLAFIICIIVSVVVHFKVREEINESLPDIGSLQAMGYTTGQIMLSVIGEFGISSLTGAAAGVVFACALNPLLTSYNKDMIGILLVYKGTLAVHLISSLSVFLLTVLSAFAATYKLRTLPPITAFRKGVKNHHFKKNYFPLHRGSGSVYYRLALKNMAANVRQNVTITSIIGLGIFAMGLTIILYMNLGYDNSAIPRMTGIEVSDIQVTLLPHVDSLSFGEELKELKEVRKVNPTSTELLKVDGEWVLFVVSPDFHDMEILSAARGEVPVYDNEIALSSMILRKLNKEIGDTVSVDMDGISKDYLITGVTMGSNNGGKMGLVSLDGIRRLSPYYTPGQLHVYLKNPKEAADLIEKLYARYGTAETANDQETQPNVAGKRYADASQKAQEQIKLLLKQYGIASVEYAVMLDGEIILSGGSSNYKIKEMVSLTEYLEGQLKSYAVMISGLVAMILCVMLIIIGSVISITIKSLLRRQREEFGIYKALGYTTKDLVKIISLNFLLNAGAGALLGIVSCKLSANYILGILFRNMGMDIVDFKVDLWWLAAMGIIAVVYIFLLCAWKACKVKKISVYELLTE